MAVLFFYDQMVPVPQPELPSGVEQGQRQLEVFELNNQVHVRLGPVDEENAGLNRYTAVLSIESARQMIDALESALFRIGGT